MKCPQCPNQLFYQELLVLLLERKEMENCYISKTLQHIHEWNAQCFWHDFVSLTLCMPPAPEQDVQNGSVLDTNR